MSRGALDPRFQFRKIKLNFLRYYIGYSGHTQVRFFLKNVKGGGGGRLSQTKNRKLSVPGRGRAGSVHGTVQHDDAKCEQLSLVQSQVFQPRGMCDVSLNCCVHALSFGCMVLPTAMNALSDAICLVAIGLTTAGVCIRRRRGSKKEEFNIVTA